MEETGLVKFDAAIYAIAKARSVDEVKDIRDKAEAARTYAKQAGISLQGQNMLAEIKIRAERKAGEILAAMPGKGKQGGDRKSTTTMGVDTLKELGITDNQSSRWQAEATVPDKEFEEHVKEITEAGKELTSASVQRLARKIAPKPETPPLPKGTYDVIYADPPWRYDFAASDSRKIENQYPTMDIEEIKQIEIPTGVNAVLYLWATVPKLCEALDILSSWGFLYRSSMVWDKEIIGMGYWFRNQHELLLLGTKGNVTVPKESDRVSSVYKERRGKHSAKPVIVRDWIKKWHPRACAIELFAREKHDGWESWGNEI